MKVNVKRLAPEAVIPSYAKDGDAGMDLTATSIVETEDYVQYGTGLSVEIPEGYVGLIFPRSSISKISLVQANSVGVVDSGYRGEILVRFKRILNPITNLYFPHYSVLERIAQLIIIPYPQIELEEVEELSLTERGSGGFGHSGV